MTPSSVLRFHVEHEGLFLAFDRHGAAESFWTAWDAAFVCAWDSLEEAAAHVGDRAKIRMSIDGQLVDDRRRVVTRWLGTELLPNLSSLRELTDEDRRKVVSVTMTEIHPWEEIVHRGTRGESSAVLAAKGDLPEDHDLAGDHTLNIDTAELGSPLHVCFRCHGGSVAFTIKPHASDVEVINLMRDAIDRWGREPMED